MRPSNNYGSSTRIEYKELKQKNRKLAQLKRRRILKPIMWYFVALFVVSEGVVAYYPYKMPILPAMPFVLRVAVVSWLLSSCCLACGMLYFLLIGDN